MADIGSSERTGLQEDIRKDFSPAALVSQLLVPILLGLLGFCAVAAAVSSTAGVMGVTVSGLAVVVTLLLAAGLSPRYLPAFSRGSWPRVFAAAAAAGALHLLLYWTAGSTVLLSLPAFPIALAGGALLLATSLWSQFRRGPAAEDPVTLPQTPARPFAQTLVLVLANWVFFAAAGMFSAWIMLGR
ncbi:hypothetical protein LOC59_02305 [Arthrobacter sp. zg-Y916]|uniref:hypothetical protein n=1 Tax=Arthrobacter sp. zg-Y916 TaxID=2894190 RepID=UPI001E37BCB5|nr:hypothetical protein [Arthrobacter sp. zg-Y916]MCC9192487.1 hypothetical protein [Arthrobacter sp. zg-Y916]